MSGRVAWISLAPVKATALHHVDEIDLLESGPKGDRRFYFVSDAGRLLNNKDSGPLQVVRSEYDELADTLALRFEDGTVVSAPVERGEEIETRFHSRPRTGRLIRGPWADAVSELVGEPVRLVEPAHGAADRGRSGAATLLGTASLGALAETLGVEGVDGRRFRMNFGIDGLDAARRGHVARPQDRGRRGRRRAAGQRRQVRRHDPEPGHRAHRPGHARRPSPPTAGTSRPPSRCPSGCTQPWPSPAACGSATASTPSSAHRPIRAAGRRLVPQGFTGGRKWVKVGISGPPAW